MSKAGGAFVEKYFRKSRKHWRERERRRKLEGNDEEQQGQRNRRCSVAEQGLQLVEDPCRNKFSLKGKWHMDDPMPEQLYP